MSPKPRVLFLCTGNSCRSQMAEAFAKMLKSHVLDSYSAGVETHGINPHAAAVMKELGYDLNSHQSQKTSDLPVKEFEYVVTVCDNAKEACPYFPAKTKLMHHSFPDPPGLTKDLPDGEEKLAVYREVRDQIRDFVETLPEAFEL